MQVVPMNIAKELVDRLWNEIVFSLGPRSRDLLSFDTRIMQVREECARILQSVAFDSNMGDRLQSSNGLIEKYAPPEDRFREAKVLTPDARAYEPEPAKPEEMDPEDMIAGLRSAPRKGASEQASEERRERIAREKKRAGEVLNDAALSLLPNWNGVEISYVTMAVQNMEVTRSPVMGGWGVPRIEIVIRASSASTDADRLLQRMAEASQKKMEIRSVSVIAMRLK